MRQVGVLGACGLIALRDMVARLRDDHCNARLLAGNPLHRSCGASSRLQFPASRRCVRPRVSNCPLTTSCIYSE